MHKLPKERILRGYKAFSGVLAGGESCTSGTIRLFYAPATTQLPIRAGFTVLRGIRKAVVRNRIKRCLREAYRRHQNEIPAGVGTVVFLYRGTPASKPSELDCRSIENDMIASLEKLAKKVGR